MIRKEKESVTETEELGFIWSGDTRFKTDMMTQEGKAKIYVPVNESWNVGAETSIQIKTNHTARILIGVTLLFVLASVLFMWRIRALEVKNEKLQSQIMEIQLWLPELIENRKKQDNILKALERNDDLTENGVRNDGGQSEHNRFRRQVNMKGENTTTQSENEVWSTTDSSSHIRDRDRGKMSRRKMALSREKDRIAIAKLKMKLKNARIRANQSKILARQPSLLCDTRAAYLVVNGPDVEIRKRGQHIGPWYIADNGSEYGFQDMWYQGLSLGSNGTSVIFSESGLHLIYAQVYYTLFQDEKDSEPEPLGFRIYLKKHGINSKKRPFQIAECVPSYPSTTYQTCFTQVAWYVGSGDEIFLQHFTSSLPLIEAEKVGQTFLGIVKLSGSR